MRLPIVAVGCAAWLAISNHCAIAAVRRAPNMTMPSCHGAPVQKHAPTKDEQRGGTECCKVLRATLLTVSSNLAVFNTEAFSAYNYVVALMRAAEESRPVRGYESDTGPPGAKSFAESVLQRSILAHAPPRFLS